MSDLISSISGLWSQITDVTGTTASATPMVDNVDDILVSLNSFHAGFSRCRSEHESSVLIANHVKYLKWQLTSTQLTENQTSLLIKRCAECKSLGYDVDFASIHAMKLAQSASEWKHKLTAYMACQQLLNEGSDKSILMVSTLYRDVMSRHVPSILLALSTVSEIISAELIPAIDKPVEDRLKHSSPLVRRKAVACLGAFIQRNPSLIDSKMELLKAALKDKDPRVMALTLQIYTNLPDSVSLGDLIKPLVFITSQVIAGKLPAGFTRNGVCGGQILTNLVKLLSRAGASQEEWKQKILVILLSILDKYENVATVTAISVVTESCMVLPVYTDSVQYLERIVKYAEKLLKSKWSNYKHTGLKILTVLIQSNRSLIMPCQGLIVSSLNSGDLVLAQKAMALIVKLTTQTNIESVYELFTQTAKSSVNVASMQKQGVDILMCCDLTDVKLDWFFEKLVQLFELGPVPQPILNNILSHISKSQNESAVLGIYEHLYKSISSTDMRGLESLSTLLWIRVTHRSKFDSLDEKLCPLITTVCKNVMMMDGMTAFLTLLRDATSCKVLVLKEDDLDSVRQMITRCQCEVGSYHMIADLSEVVSSSQLPPRKRIAMDDDLWRVMEKYTSTKLSCQECRPYKVTDQSVAAEANPLKFSQQSDTQMRVTEEDVVLKPARAVWTSKGRISRDSARSDLSDTGSNSAPVEFDIDPEDEEHENRTTELASHIFSNL